MSASQRPSRFLALLFACASFAWSQTIVITPGTNQLSAAGGTITFTATASYTSPPSTLGLSLAIPTGWSYVSGTSIPGAAEPMIAPTAGRVQLLEWAIPAPPAGSATFTFTLAYAPNIVGPLLLTPTLIARDGTGGTPTVVSGPAAVILASSNVASWLGGTGLWSDSAQWTPQISPNDTRISVNIAAGLATLTSDIALENLVFTGGTITGANVLTLTGPASVWTAGTFTGGSETIIAPGAQLSASGAAAHNFTGRTLRNQGTFVWADSGPLQSGSGGVFVNSSNAAFVDVNTGDTNAVMSSTGGAFSFSNAGAYSKAGSGTTHVAIPFANSGNILLTAGNMHFSATFVQTAGLLFIRAGTIGRFDQGLTLNGGVLQGAGTVLGNVTSNGVIAPGESVGTLTLQGSLSLLASSKLSFEIAGTGAGSGHDFLSVTGTTALNGSLILSMLPGADTALTASDTLTLLTATSLTGIFTNLPDGTRFQAAHGVGSFVINYSPTSVQLTNFIPVPEPSTWIMLGVGAAVVFSTAWRRRRR